MKKMNIYLPTFFYGVFYNDGGSLNLKRILSRNESTKYMNNPENDEVFDKVQQLKLSVSCYGFDWEIDYNYDSRLSYDIDQPEEYDIYGLISYLNPLMVKLEEDTGDSEIKRAIAYENLGIYNQQLIIIESMLEYEMSDSFRKELEDIHTAIRVSENIKIYDIFWQPSDTTDEQRIEDIDLYCANHRK